jgi:hypothetical protein
MTAHALKMAAKITKLEQENEILHNQLYEAHRLLVAWQDSAHEAEALKNDTEDLFIETRQLLKEAK